MTVNPILQIIRAKKLGVLIRDVREKSGKSPEDCAQAMGISADEYKAIESGERPLTLPELELFAYRLDVPMEHFWGNSLFSPDEHKKVINAEEIKQLRQKVIGDLLHKARAEASVTVDELAQQTGMTAEMLQSYEQGDIPVPVPVLETIAQVLNNPIGSFEDQQGPVGSWLAEQRNTKEFLALPPELQEFVGKPINRPYLELAVRLSELKVEKLRALAEGLLEITL